RSFRRSRASRKECLSLKVVESSRERHHDKRGCRSSLRGGRIKDSRVDDPTRVGIVASDRLIPVYPVRPDSPLAPAGAGWIALATPLGATPDASSSFSTLSRISFAFR